MSEQVVFGVEKKLREENAKAVEETVLLEIPVFLYRRIFEELTLYGYKGEFLMMEAGIRRGYIEKQSLRRG